MLGLGFRDYNFRFVHCVPVQIIPSGQYRHLIHARNLSSYTPAHPHSLGHCRHHNHLTTDDTALHITVRYASRHDTTRQCTSCKGVHSGVTGGSQGGHRGVHRGVTGGAQWGHRGFTGASQGGHRGVTGGPQWGHRGVTGRSQGGHRAVTGGSQGGHRGVTRGGPCLDAAATLPHRSAAPLPHGSSLKAGEGASDIRCPLWPFCPGPQPSLLPRPRPCAPPLPPAAAAAASASAANQGLTNSDPFFSSKEVLFVGDLGWFR